MENNNRRKFIKRLAGGMAMAGSVPNILNAKSEEAIELAYQRPKITANDTIRFATIGMGIMGFNNTDTALKVEGAELVAVCDLYKGRLDRAKEVYGKQIDTTFDYRKILERSDIDAVIVATTDHWHDHITIAALDAGKHVYCEKPMVQHIDEGLAVIEAEKRSGKVLQIGSQGVSSIENAEAKKLYEAGDIGELVLVETWNDRQSALGAWQYSIPRDASKKTIKWNQYLGDAPKHDFDPLHFFRWRNYQAYGTGVAGDLFVHLFSGLHAVLESNGPERIYATGGLRYWKDGRDVADVMMALFDYPETDKHSAFNMQMRVNFIDGGGGGQKTRLVGTEGILEIGWGSLNIKRRKMATAPGFGGWDSYNTFTEKQQKSYKKWYEKEYQSAVASETSTKNFKAPQGYDAHLDHHTNFFNAIRENGKVVEDGSFGLRACAPSLAANTSIYEKKVIHWNPEKMILKQA